MEGFVIYDKDYHEINEAGLRVIHTSNAGDRIVHGDPQKPAYFGFKCPRERGVCNYLRIRGGPVDDGKRPTWVWNGSWASPTFQPSINCLASGPDPQEPTKTVEYAGCGWHGFITAGVCSPPV